MTEQTQSLLARLQAETIAFNQFYDTLQAEQKALTSNDVSALATVSQIKLRQVETLNRLAAERVRHLASLGFRTDSFGMDLWLTRASDPERNAWNELLEIARKASASNQLNGKLIQQNLKHHQQALTVLMTAANQVSLYGADGQPQGIYPVGGNSRGIIGTA